MSYTQTELNGMDFLFERCEDLPGIEVSEHKHPEAFEMFKHLRAAYLAGEVLTLVPKH